MKHHPLPITRRPCGATELYTISILLSPMKILLAFQFPSMDFPFSRKTIYPPATLFRPNCFLFVSLFSVFFSSFPFKFQMKNAELTKKESERMLVLCTAYSYSPTI